jgi:hypothetical protein
MTSITDDELQEVKQLNQDFQTIFFQVGELSILEYDLQNQLSEIKTELNNFYSSLKTLRNKEVDLLDKLKLLYPNQSINFETGELL